MTTCSHNNTLVTCAGVVPRARMIAKLVSRFRTFIQEASKLPTNASSKAVTDPIVHTEPERVARLQVESMSSSSINDHRNLVVSNGIAGGSDKPHHERGKRLG